MFGIITFLGGATVAGVFVGTAGDRYNAGYYYDDDDGVSYAIDTDRPLTPSETKRMDKVAEFNALRST